MSLPLLTVDELRARTEEFVRAELSKNDGSHDWHHIARVRALAVSLAAEDGLASAEDLQLVELAALLHDIADWKYSGSETKGVEMAKEFLLNQNFPADRTGRVCSLIELVGFKSELGRLEAAAGGDATPLPAVDPLLGFVQDADRLDAIGAVGIARCFTFGGTKGRPLYDPEQPARADLTMAQYKSASTQAPSINHFHEKLLKLKDLMKTNAGKKRALQRHQFMVDFLQEFDDEVAGRA